MTWDCRAADCTWRPSRGDGPDPDQLRAHALEQGHGLCCVCGRSLTEHEPQTCVRCADEAAEHLRAILDLYDELPDHLGHVRSPAYDSDRPSASDGRPLPGGDVLVLLARGSQGLAEDGVTDRVGDPVSVHFELTSWQREWEERRGER